MKKIVKNIKFTKKKIIIITAIASSFLLIFLCTTSFGMQHYYKLDFSTGLVTASRLNVRSGPGTGYSVVTTVNKNEYVRVFAGIGNWYIIQTPGDFVGAVSQKYIKPIYPTGSGTSSGTSTNTGASGNSSGTSTTSSLTADELETFNLINQQRANNGLSALKVDSELQRVARIKAQDMVNNNYFDHNSPTYGTPFNMMKNFGISYKTAGENIAGNSSNSAAVTAWMNSSGHRANILNSSYNYTGLAVVSSPRYGKIYVQMFIGK
ncbi:MAG: SH3 domain-containing protein [Clostridia bacterium]|nr:SH3 domain-containing protein [Clostridia bacterium]